MNVYYKLDIDTRQEDVFEEYFHSFYEGLHRYAFSILKNNEDAKDIVQSAFTNLWEKRNEVDIRHSARAYLYTAVHNLSLNMIRNKKVRDMHLNRQIFAPAKPYAASDYEEEAKNIQSLIEMLPPVCREVFCKSRFEQRKYADIALDLNISVKTVEAHMGKALKILRTLTSAMILTVVVFFL